MKTRGSKHLRPAERDALKAAIREGLYRGEELKSVAIELGQLLSLVYKLANEMGFTRTLITREERQLLATWRLQSLNAPRKDRAA